MRMLYSVHQDRQVMVTGSSPEPLIAEASAQIMHYRVGSNGNEKTYMDVWSLLGTFVDEGLLAQGTIGELIGRVLSISAMDNAINALTDHCELKYQTPVTVAAYYKELLTDDAWNVLRRSVPANRVDLSEESATRTFEDAFADAYFHFSHYGKANDDTPIQDSFAWALWLRGTAVLWQLNQSLSDRGLPIYFSKLGPVAPKTMSMNFEQDKTGLSEDPRTVGIQSAEILGLFSEGNMLPYIAAVHCYALTKDEKISVTTPISKDLRRPAEDQAAPCYQIDFRGLAPYRNLTEPIKTHIRSMIDGSKNYLFNHHPRQFGLPVLRQMLPVLIGHSDATAWFGGLGNGDMPSCSKGKKKAPPQGMDVGSLSREGQDLSHIAYSPL
jgi:hypothetical protein